MCVLCRESLLITKHHSCTRYVWVLEGDTGKVLEGWPVKLPSEVLAAALVTKLVPGESSAADIVSIKHTKNTYSQQRFDNITT